MTRRNQRRTGLVTLVSAGMLATLVAAAPGTAEAASSTGIVTTGGISLNVRSGPSAASKRLGTLKEGSRVRLLCYVRGQRVAGKIRTTVAWDKLSTGGYVSDAYLKRSGRLPVCAAKPAPKPTNAARWVAPLSSVVGSGFRSAHRPTHDGIDLAARRYTPIKSVAYGTVIRVVCNASTNNCDVDGSPKIRGCGWYVEVQHAGKIVTRYCHMVRRPPVEVGQVVHRGEVIGHVGSSGSSSGPHLHFEVHVNAAPVDRSNAVDPVPFLRARGAILDPVS